MSDMVKKVFLQVCLNHGSLKLDDVRIHINSICLSFEKPPPKDDDALREFIHQLHQEISNYDQALTFYVHPVAGVEYLVFSEVIGNKKCLEYVGLKLEDQYYFSNIIKHMAQQPDYSMDNMKVFDVLQAIKTSTKASTLHIQNLVQKWIKQGYFYKTEDKYYLGPRMIVEFGTPLKEAYPNYFRDCPLCDEIVLWDESCSACKIKIHRQCIQKYLLHNNDCPVCHVNWITRSTTMDTD